MTLQQSMAEVNTTQTPAIVKEGWLKKRGEHIKNWRQRYFLLLEDGKFLGFKTKPQHGLGEPLNDFTVKKCLIMKMERPRSNSFIIRGLSWTTAVIQRFFNAESDTDREAWMEAIQQVADRLSNTTTETCQQIQETESIEQLQLNYYNDDYDYDYDGSLRSKKKINISSNNVYAIKIIRKDVIIKRDEVAHILTESKVLQIVDHPFLTSLKYSFRTDNHLCFVMEYVSGGDLFFHIGQDRIFTEERAKFYGAEICLALGYLHERDIIYRDLKASPGYLINFKLLENLLLDADGHIKIADFGLCKENMSYHSTTRTFCGTPEYIAPEVLQEDSYGHGVDWWGYGVCLYEMMVGRLPFYELGDINKLFRLIKYEDVRFPSTISPKAQDLLKGLLHKDPYKRLGGGLDDAKEIQDHPFYNNINWKLLEEKKLTPPFKPQITSDTDTRYFGPEFTEGSVSLTPPPAQPQLLNDMEEEAHENLMFRHFSYQDYPLASSFNSFIDAEGQTGWHQED
ncbi:hypothetical protein Pmani_007591 [Petrolisthes manimaculis]|uniref:non-specific serine/threonine protein kinase n=1 Tax=Petrolisthes manimaculis TaxID=1843537 RepID=A0AAE1UKL6_9EUCA|nr:hypothetical protein Pmani_007591 [Petrolisthes manimaculis]